MFELCLYRKRNKGTGSVLKSAKFIITNISSLYEFIERSKNIIRFYFFFLFDFVSMYVGLLKFLENRATYLYCNSCYKW